MEVKGPSNGWGAVQATLSRGGILREGGLGEGWPAEAEAAGGVAGWLVPEAWGRAVGAEWAAWNPAWGGPPPADLTRAQGGSSGIPLP